MKDNLPIYLDYMATCPVDPNVIDVMLKYMRQDSHFGNASSTHYYGEQAKKAVDYAREQVAAIFEAKANEIVFTSGATEANNLAILGAAECYQRKGKHLITCQTEHKSVLKCFQQLEKSGFTVTYLSVDEKGFINLDELKKSITDKTILISIMQVNNEIGVIQDIQAITELAKQHGIIVHVDAAQSVGKVELNAKTIPVDLISLSGHKIYGPKGIGALFVKRQPRVQLQPQIIGSGQEFGLRSGTTPVQLIAGFGKAVEIAMKNKEEECCRITALRNQLWNGIKHLPEICVNGDLTHRVCGNLNISIKNIHGEALLYGLRQIAVSTGSACHSANIDPSHVLKALGLSDEVANNSLRISIGRFTTQQDIENVITLFNSEIPRLQQISVC